MLISAVRFFSVMSPSTRFGLFAIAPALLGFGFIYYYFLNYVGDVEVRQRVVRLMFTYLFAVIVIWQIKMNFGKR